MTRRDRAAFVGRDGELEAIAELFSDDPPASVVLVHGPGGIGKSCCGRWPIAAASLGGGETGEMVRTLVRRLAEAEIEGRYRDVLGVACIARVTTLELLRDVLPETDPADGLRWLESRSFAEALGGGLTLHDLVRRALRVDMMQREAERERELRRRIAGGPFAGGRC